MDELTAANNALKTAHEARERDYKAEIEKLDVKERDLLDRLKKLDENKLKVAQANGDPDVMDDDLVEINAGGKVIAVTRSTLTQFKGSKLEALFSGRWDKRIMRDCAGRIFLDVNPICFQAIVDYLNEVKISTEESPAAPPSVDLEYQSILMHQLDLFGLSDELKLFHIDSKIIEKFDHADLLNKWLDEDNSGGDLTLLYRSSSDGRNDKTFHSRCNSKGPTLTIVETNEGHIVGGYSDIHWASSSSSYQHSNEAFLFAISRTDAYPPSKMKLTGSNNQYAIYNNKSYGPTFGNANNGTPDFRVQNAILYLNIGHYDYNYGTTTYAAPPSQLSGGRNFNIKEMEVFQVLMSPNSPKLKKPRNEKARKSDNQVAAASDQSPSKNRVQGFSTSINLAINQKWATLLKFESEIVSLESSFQEEDKFVTFFSTKNDNDVISLNVCGTFMATTQESLQLSKDSTLAAKILDPKKDTNCNQKPAEEWSTGDVVAWLNNIEGLSLTIIKSFENDEVTGRELLTLGKEGLKDFGVTKRGTLFYLLSEIEKLKRAEGEAAVLIEHSPYCFAKIIDHLRLENMFIKGIIVQKPAVPIVRDSEKARFEKVVKHYFPGKSSKPLLGK